MSRVKLRCLHSDVLFEFTKHDVHVYTSCCGARVPRRKVKRLHEALTRWLDRTD